MKITAERQPESQILLEIEVEPERVEKSVDQAYRRMVGRYRIPGFRPGKAPRIMFERYVGRETLLREALERLVPEIYDEAVKEQALDPIDQPKFEIPTFDPLTIKATVPLRPTVRLNDYRELRVERESVAVDEAEVERTIEELRRRYATLEPVDRPVQPGDVLTLNLTAHIGDRELLAETDANLRLTEEGTRALPGLLEKLPGAVKGQPGDFEYAIPEDYDDKDVAGETIRYHATVNEIKAERVPELNDEFAREVGEGFDSYAALRERLENDVRQRATEQAERDYEQKVLEQLIEQANLEYPAVLVDREIDHMVNEQTGGGSRANLEAALRRAGRSEAEYRAELKPFAVQRVQRSLVLTRLAEQEGLAVEAPEIEAEIDRMGGPATPQNVRMREMFASPSGREFIERTLLTRRVYERLRDIGEGKDVPPQAVADAAPETAPAEIEPAAAASPDIAAAEPESEVAAGTAEVATSEAAGAAPAAEEKIGEGEEQAKKGRGDGSDEDDTLRGSDAVEPARADA